MMNRAKLTLIVLFLLACGSPGFTDGYEMPPLDARARTYPSEPARSLSHDVRPRVFSTVPLYAPYDTTVMSMGTGRPASTLVIGAGGTWLYAQPNLASKVLDFIPEGAEISILGVQGPFFFVRYGALLGYIPASAIERYYQPTAAAAPYFGYWTRWGWFWRWRQ